MKVKCHTTECTNAGRNDFKGLCRRCYSEAVELVKLRKTTWTELINLGLCIETERKKRRNKPLLFADKFISKKAEIDNAVCPH